MNDFREKLVEGALSGIFAAATMYIVVQLIGFNSRSLAVILYLQLIFGITLTMRSAIASPIIPLLKRIVVVAEGEEMKLKRLLTGEEYRVGEVEKL